MNSQYKIKDFFLIKSLNLIYFTLTEHLNLDQPC